KRGSLAGSLMWPPRCGPCGSSVGLTSGAMPVPLSVDLQPIVAVPTAASPSAHAARTTSRGPPICDPFMIGPYQKEAPGAPRRACSRVLPAMERLHIVDGHGYVFRAH